MVRMGTNRRIAKKIRLPRLSCVKFRWWIQWVRFRTCVWFASTARQRVTMRINAHWRSISSSKEISNRSHPWTVKRDFRLSLNRACSSRSRMRGTERWWGYRITRLWSILRKSLWGMELMMSLSRIMEMSLTVVCLKVVQLQVCTKW